MELIDVLDKDGNKTGEIKTRAQVHAAGDWHRSIRLWVMNSKREFLLQKRTPLKKLYPNCWGTGSVGGHVTSGATILDTVVAEAQEELGIDVAPEKLEYLFSCPNEHSTPDGKYIARHWCDAYLLEADYAFSDFVLQPSEVSEVRYVPWTELEKIFLARTPGYIFETNHFARLLPLLRERFGKI